MSHDHYTWNRRLPALYSVIRERETHRLQSVSRISRSSWVTITTPETEDFLHYIVLLERERPTDYSQSHGSVVSHDHYTWNRRLPALYSVIRERETHRLQSVSRISRSSWVTITTPETEDFLHYIVLLERERPTDYSQSHGSVVSHDHYTWNRRLPALYSVIRERERPTDYSQPHGSVVSHDHYTWNRRLPALYSVIRERERPTDYSQSHGSVARRESRSLHLKQETSCII